MHIVNSVTVFSDDCKDIFIYSLLSLFTISFVSSQLVMVVVSANYSQYFLLCRKIF